MFLDSLRDLDLLLVPLNRTFLIKNQEDLMTNEKAMKRFLLSAGNQGSRDSWTKASGTDFDTMYENIGDALDSLNLTGAVARRHELVENGMMQVFAKNYDIHALPSSVETTDLRAAGSAEYLKRMRQYTDSVVVGVEDVIQLNAQNKVDGSWRDQVRSKIRYLTSARGGRPPRPFMCVQLLLHFHRELSRTPDAIKEVCIQLFTYAGSRCPPTSVESRCCYLPEVGTHRLPRVAVVASFRAGSRHTPASAQLHSNVNVSMLTLSSSSVDGGKG